VIGRANLVAGIVAILDREVDDEDDDDDGEKRGDRDDPEIEIVYLGSERRSLRGEQGES
jgi:hypothetical protein